MAFNDTYIANHHDRLLRLDVGYQGRSIAPGSRGEEAVKVASRRWEELMWQGYRVVNPRATASESRKAEIGRTYKTRAGHAKAFISGGVEKARERQEERTAMQRYGRG